jgi:hypothetical protein
MFFFRHRRTALTTLISGAFETALVAQLDRASDFESEGREFESLRARQPHLSPRFTRDRLNIRPRVGTPVGARSFRSLTTDGSLFGADPHLSQRSLPQADIAPLPEQASKLTTSARLPLWTGKRYLTFRAEDIAIKACNPMPPARRHVEIPYFCLDVGRHAVPIKLRVAVDDVGG